MKLKKIIASVVSIVMVCSCMLPIVAECYDVFFVADAAENDSNYGWTKLDMGVDYDVTAISKNDIKVDNTSETPEAWWLQAMYEGVRLESGKVYELSFTLSADREEYMHADVQECPEPYTVYSLNKYLATKEKTRYSQIFTMSENCENAKIAFCFGYGEGTFFIDDIQFNEIGENLVNRNTSWNTYSIDGSSVEFNHPFSDFSIGSDVSKEGKFGWSIGINTNNFIMNNGRKYLISYDAKGDKGNILCTVLQRTAGKYFPDKEDQYYYAAMNDYVELSEEFQHYSYVIDVTEDTFDNWYLGFNPSQGKGEFTIDNVVVCDIGQSDAKAVPIQCEYTTERIDCKNGDSEIFGICYKPKKDEKVPLVILSHELGGTHKNMERYASALASNGYAAYIFDYCGGSPYSQSDGSMLDMSVKTEISDLEAILQSAKNWEFINQDRIVLLGGSQGGLVTALTAEKHPNDIAGAILLYPALGIPESMRLMFNTKNGIPDSFMYLFKTAELGKTYAYDAWDIDPYEIIGQDYTKAVLILHGSADPLVDVSYSEKAASCYKDCELHILQDSQHGFTGIQLNQAIEYILDYLNENVSDTIGDVNGDGQFTIADLVILQRWLLAVPDAKLINWKAADLCKDDRIDVFDLCLLKQALIKK